jgi:hypothetical protein
MAKETIRIGRMLINIFPPIFIPVSGRAEFLI